MNRSNGAALSRRVQWLRRPSRRKETEVMRSFSSGPDALAEIVFLRGSGSGPCRRRPLRNRRSLGAAPGDLLSEVPYARPCGARDLGVGGALWVRELLGHGPRQQTTQ